MLQEPMGYVFAVENSSNEPFGLQVDSSDSVGMISSREGGACGCIDLVPPKSRKLVLAVGTKQGVQRSTLSFAFDALPPEAVAWAIPSQDLHMALPLTPLACQQGSATADEAILHAKPPPRRRKPLAVRGKQVSPAAGQGTCGIEESDADAEAALAEALRLSLGDCGDGGIAALSSTDDITDVEDELALAIRLSMQQQPPQQQLAAPVTVEAQGGAKMQQLVKQLFDEYRKQGLPPNEAAVKAMADAKTQTVKDDSSAANVSTPSGNGSKNPQQVVKELFDEYRKQGFVPSEAAVKALEAAKTRGHK